MSFIDNVNLLAKIRGETLSNVCEKVGLSESDVSALVVKPETATTLAAFFKVDSKKLLTGKVEDFLLFSSETASLKKDYQQAFKSSYSLQMIVIPFFLLLGVICLLVNDVLQNPSFHFLLVFYVLVCAFVLFVSLAYPILKYVVNVPSLNAPASFKVYSDRVEVFFKKEKKNFYFASYTNLGEMEGTFLFSNSQNRFFVLSKQGLTEREISQLRAYLKGLFKGYEWYGKESVQCFANEVEEKEALKSISKRSLWLLTSWSILSFLDFLFLSLFLFEPFFDTYLSRFGVGATISIPFTVANLALSLYYYLARKSRSWILWLLFGINALLLVAYVVLMVIGV